MKVLVVGSGGREHALAWKLSQGGKVKKIFIAPGNAGTAMCGENVNIAPDDIEALKGFALEEKIDLTVVGPEIPLTLGIVDTFKEAGLRIFGPTKAAALIEGSKAFCKDLMARHGIPSAAYKKFDDANEALSYIKDAEVPVVIKADGLAAGKGVIICETRAAAAEAISLMMEENAFGEAGNSIVIEEFLTGEEVSILAITDGKTVIALPPAQDHKAIFDGGKGPNTGGMGAYSPTPVITGELEKEVLDTVIIPVIKAMEAEGRRYTGVLYAGLMVSGGSPRVLEFNCRFGDPETQPILMRLNDGDGLFDILWAAAEGSLKGIEPRWSEKASVCVVMSAGGYPGGYEKGKIITGLEEAGAMEDVMVFHAGTERKNGNVVTSGGRVLGVTALGDTIGEAVDRAYGAVKLISWDGAYYRKDIGLKAIKR
ncbi:MAG: phosphoribosylamine--glycine ligase [Thermodesulfobacteriota bacterium]|nr:MAG: phosphoribosylamine--glycine ligase [Thermodesulfobacteriota bacterium]